MIRIKILSPGKIRESWLNEAIQEYIKRLTQVADFDFVCPKDEKTFTKLLSEEKNCIYLDPAGKTFTSEAFSTYFLKSVEKGGSSITFAIGGAEGFPKGTIASPSLSLSPMTFTHHMTRLILVEQIFRAFEIEKGTNYHK